MRIIEDIRNDISIIVGNPLLLAVGILILFFGASTVVNLLIIMAW